MNSFDFKKIYLKLKKYLIPQENILGLEINDKVVKIFGFDGDTSSVRYSGIVQIAPGVIKNGFLEKPGDLLNALNVLKNNTFKGKKFIPYVIISLPANNFYTNILTIPKNSVSEGNVAEAIQLNTRMLSPIPLEKAYFDWEFIKEKETEDSASVFVGVGDKVNIDKYLGVLEEVGFKVIAVEKPAFGLLRFIQEYTNNKEPYLLIDIDRDGIDLILADENELLFYDFDSWQDVMGYDLQKFLTTVEFENYLITKIAPIISFYQTRYGGILKDFYLFSVITNLKGHAMNFIQTRFMMKAMMLNATSPNFVKNVAEEWYSVIGTAKRGLIPRGEDTIVSFMGTGTETEYIRTKTVRYLSTWTKISATVLLSLSLLYFGLEGSIFKAIKSKVLAQTQISTNVKDLNLKRTSLEKKADEFNFYVTGMSQAVLHERNWAHHFKTFFDEAKDHNVNILKIFISEPSNNVTLQAACSSRSIVNEFKDSLESTGMFVNITAPLESITEDNGTFYFSLKFGFK